MQTDSDTGVIVTRSAEGIVDIRLNRPDRLNSFTAEMHRELAAALAEAKEATEKAFEKARSRIVDLQGDNMRQIGRAHV